jgi:CheY-like chemotaxis protein
MRVLITDDSEDGREVAEAILIAAGYEDVSTVESAAEAYRFLGIGEAAQRSALCQSAHHHGDVAG